MTTWVALSLIALACTAARGEMRLSYRSQLLGDSSFRIVISPSQESIGLGLFVAPDHAPSLRYRVYQVSGVLGAPITEGILPVPSSSKGEIERPISLAIPFPKAEKALHFRVFLEGSEHTGAAEAKLGVIDVFRVGQQELDDAIRTIRESALSIGIMGQADAVQEILTRYEIPFHHLEPSEMPAHASLAIQEIPPLSDEVILTKTILPQKEHLIYFLGNNDHTPVWELSDKALVLARTPSLPGEKFPSELALLQTLQSHILNIQKHTP